VVACVLPSIGGSRDPRAWTVQSHHIDATPPGIIEPFMSRRLVVFISSTVEDFQGVRAELKADLEQRNFEVRLSEDASFPVAPGVSSHDACLRAVRSSDVFVLLIGTRFGGEYQGQNKSITWREWDEAMDAKLLPIVLVRHDANEIVREIHQTRRTIVQSMPNCSVREIDEELRKDPRFADAKPLRDNLPGVQRFIDVLRKGHVDNWLHLDWDGSAKGALDRINIRTSAAFAAYHEYKARSQDIAERYGRRTDALLRLLSVVTTSAMKIASREVEPNQAVASVLKLLELDRALLLEFRDEDIHNFVVYLQNGNELQPQVRAHHRDLQPRNRSWRIGEGHIGLAAREPERLFVSGDIRQTEAWVPDKERAGDRASYVSVISAPFSWPMASGDVRGVFSVTSSRVDHFRDPKQLEALTVGTLAAMLGMLLSAGKVSSP
jgi:Domain of unknown function (DUF4062)